MDLDPVFVTNNSVDDFQRAAAVKFCVHPPWVFTVVGSEDSEDVELVQLYLRDSQFAERVQVAEDLFMWSVSLFCIHRLKSNSPLKLVFL